MTAMIAVLQPFDQSTLERMRDLDPVVQRYRTRFALFDWSSIGSAPQARARPSRPSQERLSQGGTGSHRRTSGLHAALASLPAGSSPAGARTGLSSLRGSPAALWFRCGQNRPQCASFEPHAPEPGPEPLDRPVHPNRARPPSRDPWPAQAVSPSKIRSRA